MPGKSGDVEERWIETATHGRYLVAGGDGERRQGLPLLVGFHGYGENAERHLEQLVRIPGSDAWLACAVSALHPFYNTKTGDVIDSWMTSRGRELAIGDNVAWVAKAVADVRRRWRPSERLVYAGFSQGVAMAYRAAARSGHRCHGLIALAGDVPPDVAAGVFPRVLLGRGTGDTWYTAEKMAADLETLGRAGVEVETCVFEGGHDWTGEFLERAGRFLDRIREAPPAGAAGPP